MEPCWSVPPPSRANMLSSESIIHKPDTSSASTPANYSATVCCCRRAPYAASHANCMRANINWLVYCWVPPAPAPSQNFFQLRPFKRVGNGVFRVSGRSLWLHELQKAADRWREIKNRAVVSVAFRDPPGGEYRYKKKLVVGGGGALCSHRGG